MTSIKTVFGRKYYASDQPEIVGMVSSSFKGQTNFCCILLGYLKNKL